MSDNDPPFKLTEIEDTAVPEAEIDSVPTRYKLIYIRKEDTVEHVGHPTEIGAVRDCDYRDLRPLADEGYPYYGYFTEEDGTTTLLLQDSDGATWKAFANSPEPPEVAHLVSIAPYNDEEES